MKLTANAVFAFFGIFCVTQVSHAQSANLYFGVGTATDSSSNQQIDTFQTGSPFTTPKLGGSFLDIGASLLLTKEFGAGADVSWRAAHAAYAGFQYMPVFYNFDGIYAPVSTKRFEPELHVGIGGMSLRYSFNQQECNPLTGCENFGESIASSTHFQLHFAGAVRYYLTDHVFLRPAVDVHYVANLFQFGSDIVPLAARNT